MDVNSVVTLRSDRKLFHVDKNKISSMSEYFKSRLKYEEKCLTFDSSIVSGNSLELIVEFANTGDIKMDQNNVFDLFVACDYCCVDELIALCEQYFRQNITTYNLKNLICVACTFHTSILNDLCDYISYHYADIQIRTILLKLPPVHFIELLKCERFSPLFYGIPAENKRLELYKLLTEYNRSNDVSDTMYGKMLQTLKFYNMPIKQISSIVPEAVNHTATKEIQQYFIQYEHRNELAFPKLLSKDQEKLSEHHLKKYANIQDRPRCITFCFSNSSDRYIQALCIKYASGRRQLYHGEGPTIERFEHGFFLAENEVVNGVQYGYSKGGLLIYVEFSTNFNRNIRFGSPNRYCGIHEENAPAHYYFQSFDINHFPEILGCVWIQHKEEFNNTYLRDEQVKCENYYCTIKQENFLNAIMSGLQEMNITLDRFLLFKLVHFEIWILLKICISILRVIYQVMSITLYCITMPFKVLTAYVIERSLEPKHLFTLYRIIISLLLVFGFVGSCGMIKLIYSKLESCIAILDCLI